jgi:hypothetical protein
MILDFSEDMPGYVWDHYNLSVNMSTYLVAFAISQFDKRTSATNPNFKVS